MSPHPTPLSSPTMPSSSRSEKLLRDTLLRDNRERQQLSSPPPPTRRPLPKRRHSHIASSSSHAALTKEDYARDSFLFRTAMSNPRSPSSSSSSFSQDNEDRDREYSPVRRTLFYGGDEEAINTRAYQQQHQQSTTSHRGSSPSPSSRRSGRSSNSISPSPSPLRMKRRQGSLGTDPHSTASINPLPTNDTNLRRNQSLQNTTSNRSGSAYPSPSYGRGEQALRTRLEGALAVDGSHAGNSHIVMRRRDENEVRDEQGDVPWKRGRQNIRSGSGSMISWSSITNSSSASNSNSNPSHSHFQSQSNYPHSPHSPQIQGRSYNIAQNGTSNNQRSPYCSPLSPQAPYTHSTPGVGAVLPTSSSPSRTRSQTDPHLPLPLSNPISPRRNNSSPTTTTTPPVTPRSPWSGKFIGSNSKPTKKSPLPLALGNVVDGKAEEGLKKLPTPPPSPSPMTRISLGSGRGQVPSPYKTATAAATPNGTPTKIPVRTQSPRRKEGGLDMRMPTQGPVAAVAVDFPSRHRPRDVTITQQSQQTLRSPLKSNNNADGHSLNSSESCSSGTSAFSASHLHVGCAAGYSACSSHSSLDVVGALPQSPHFSDSHHFVQRSHSIPSSPTTPFNARKASTQCRAIQGYVSFASVEGLGEPPLVGDEFEGGEDGRKANGGKGRKESLPFLPLSVLNAALGWKKFLGGTGAEPGIGHGVEGPGVVV